MQEFFNLIMDTSKFSYYSKSTLFFLRPIIRLLYFIKFYIFIFLFLHNNPIEKILYSYAKLLTIFFNNSNLRELNEINPLDLFKVTAMYKNKDMINGDIIYLLYTFYKCNEYGKSNGVDFIFTEYIESKNKNDHEFRLTVEVDNINVNYSFDYLYTQNLVYNYYKKDINRYTKLCIKKCLLKIAANYIAEI